MGNVLPVGVPPQLSVDAGDDQARNGDTGTALASSLLYNALDVAAIDPAAHLRCRSLPFQYAINAHRDSLDRQLPPELARLVGVLGNASTLTVELVVLGAGKLLGALGAVIAGGGAAGAERSSALSAQSHARG